MSDNLVTISRMYESKSKSKNGKTYFVGYLGQAKVVLLSTSDVSDSGSPIWNLCVAEKQPRSEGQS